MGFSVYQSVLELTVVTSASASLASSCPALTDTPHPFPHTEVSRLLNLQLLLPIPCWHIYCPQWQGRSVAFPSNVKCMFGQYFLRYLPSYTQLYRHLRANYFLYPVQQPVRLPQPCTNWLTSVQLLGNSLCLPAPVLLLCNAVIDRKVNNQRTHAPPRPPLPPPLNAAEINVILNKNK